jgi:hypothetical protein
MLQRFGLLVPPKTCYHLSVNRKDEPTVTVSSATTGNPKRLRSPQEAWERLRGALKDVYAALGGGEAYLRKERESFDSAIEKREKLVSEDLGTE